ncbi:STAS domain-containing protein [Colwellia sp. 1_MG-2023]|uniref:STAS domain-containing protein n=1 Tax=Colwellia sp. 1_MG-2023 TaxID=3062649 RepID=UPI0026E3A979|nr:STAS domain-containing protein [Colwellia sp. 1_MG-2023]MDO6444781.1 STAS domain-containing protein [Colwellia sp. 1_MG-2023]
MIEIKKQQNQLLLSGELSRKTINNVFEKKVARLLSNEIEQVDLSAVTNVDTAGLASLLLILEQTIKQSHSIHFTNIPQELLNLAKLSAVDKFLPIK